MNLRPPDPAPFDAALVEPPAGGGYDLLFETPAIRARGWAVIYRFLEARGL